MEKPEKNEKSFILNKFFDQCRDVPKSWVGDSETVFGERSIYYAVPIPF